MIITIDGTQKSLALRGFFYNSLLVKVSCLH